MPRSCPEAGRDLEATFAEKQSVFRRKQVISTFCLYAFRIAHPLNLR